MSKKKRPPAAAASSPAPTAPKAPDTVRPSAAPTAAIQPQRPLPGESGPGDMTAVILALTMFLAPTIGVPNEEMLQDTLKSIVGAFGALGAGVLFFWSQRLRTEALRWHGLVGLFGLLMVYALGSMVWSHTYLSGVEAIRWFVLALMLWLGLNSFSRERVTVLAWGIHLGAVGASLWTVLQFWVDFKLFPQGPNPASTFVNRNFFAEFVVCTLPFSLLLILRARMSAMVVLLGLTTGVNLLAIMMTGTRSAQLAFVAMLLVTPWLLWRYRKHWSWQDWNTSTRSLLALSVLVPVLILGWAPTGNAKLIAESPDALTPIARTLTRTQSMVQKEEYTQRSFSMRVTMWTATARMIAANPLTGVGAGAWEVDIPLYQTEGSQLETDYYAHNEILQLLAEYGLVGLLFLLSLLAYLLSAAWRTLRAPAPEDDADGPLRVLTLTSLLMFLIVSNAGFPWRMASTGMLFALSLGILAASDARMHVRGVLGAAAIPWQPLRSKVASLVLVGCMVLAGYISQQAMLCESKIVRAVKIALSITASGQPNNPRWTAYKKEMLDALREGVAINPHYRKITPMAADELAKWGDWKNAVWIWESVLSSRPYVVALTSNVARGYAIMNNYPKAHEYLERSRQLQPHASSVHSLEAILLAREGKEAEALALTRKILATTEYDFDLLNTAYGLAVRAQDWAMAVRSMELLKQNYPEYRADAWLRIANVYAEPKALNIPDKALHAYRQALETASDRAKPAIRGQIPKVYLDQL